MNRSATLKCVICGSDEISIIGGHVHKGDEIIIAKVCKEHKDHQLQEGCKGCYGNWEEWMGEEKNWLSVGTLKYLNHEKINIPNINNKYTLVRRGKRTENEN